MKPRVDRLAAIALALACVAVGSAQSARSELVDANQLLRDLRVLSADDMQGRRAGTPGGLKARAYVVERFKASGLAPFGASYEHAFPLRRRESDTEARTGANVVGRIDGTRPQRRYIVVTAHYDHIGVGASGQVFNGADDNASGTAALFALASHFKAKPTENSLIFAALDGEESGLEGARAFVRTPPVEAGALVLNVNLDMIGRDPGNTLYVVGTRQQPFLKPYIERVAAKAPVRLLMGHDDPAQKEDWTRDSDHYAFCQAKIPCLYFGVEDFANHHKATDDYETMTHAFYVRAVETVAQAIRELDAGLDAIAAVRVGMPPIEPQALPSLERTHVIDDYPVQVPTDTAIELAVPGGRVSGSLLMPAPVNGQVPVALIIAGSGPTDRDGNSPGPAGKRNSHRMVAEALAAQGIASVRYDKRGVAASAIKGLKEVDLRFEDFVADASAWIIQLRNDARFSSVTVIGHSEGSLIGMLAARAARADAFISLAGIARRPSDILRDQLRVQPLTVELASASEAILKGLEAGKTTAVVPPTLAALFRPSVQPYLISWFAYTPSAEIAALRVPALLVQGTTDIQVPVTEAEALKAARPEATLKVIEGMNHVLKTAPANRAANIATYSDPDRPLAPELAPSLVSFIRSVRPPRHPDTTRMSPRTVVTAVIDGARIAIEYGQPSKRGRAIWGALVPYGRWWMPGADETTTITTTAALSFGSFVVPAGDHTIYAEPGDPVFTLIINRQIFQFHTQYRPDQDVGRVPMTLARLEAPVERLTFAIEARPGGGVLKLRWDDREFAAPFTISPSAAR
jgi:pimeloyl-ACP methyl ester carboxylesterase